MIVHGIIASEAGEATPPVDPNYPTPGSGDYQTGSVGLASVTWASRGTPVNPGGNVSSVTNSTYGLFRSKYAGNFTPSPGSLPTTWNMNFFNAGTPMGTFSDTYVSFGGQDDIDPNTNFSMEWKGYVQAPESGNYNVYITCDDDTVIWIGSNALTPTNSNYTAWGSNKTVPQIVNTNSMTLTANQYYPVRIWFSEFTGACRMQIFFINSNGTKYSGNNPGGLIGFFHDGTTGGYNP